jgi:hypothetical protein
MPDNLLVKGVLVLCGPKGLHEIIVQLYFSDLWVWTHQRKQIVKTMQRMMHQNLHSCFFIIFHQVSLWSCFFHVAATSTCDLACEQALKLNWEPASMTNEFEYLRLKSWREISLVRCYNLYASAELYICQLLVANWRNNSVVGAALPAEHNALTLRSIGPIFSEIWQNV